ncbi:Mini-chromosome maintenance complex-binding protein [Trichinella papuae]|uniref:Mini-chromosome maintenance complex-binding protein n=1 Tax=Trichinella papuae TaxID=268474 RepID=A0A0V1MMR4_9BILA|nr:Mini-chromosome maintenance complex-binding protein [Trichinella papuae]
MIDDMVLDKFLDSPLLQIDNIAERVCLKEGKDYAEFKKEALNFCSDWLKGNRFLQVGLIHLDENNNLPEGCLVRCHCMVQDIRGVEYFAKMNTQIQSTDNNSAVSTETGLFRDYLSTLNYDSFVGDASTLDTRTVYTCISIPGETSWVKEILRQQYNFENTTCLEESYEFSQNKRAKVDDGESNTQQSRMQKRWFIKVIIQKICEEQEPLKLNEPVEIVGIYQQGVGENSFPFSTIHVMAVRRSRITHPDFKEFNSLSYDEIRLHCDVAAARQNLTVSFQKLLFGDQLAAEYLLCHLVSRVFKRVNSINVGSLTLNFYDVDEQLVNELNKFFDLILTKKVFVDFDTDVLNGQSFRPRKDYESDQEELLQSCLQLSDDTQMIIHDRLIDDSKLDSLGGKENFKTIAQLMEEKSVEYVYGMQTVSIPADINVLVLSRQKSALPCDIAIRLRKNNEIENPVENLSNDTIANIRKYMSLVKILDFSIPDNISERIQQYYVKMRQDQGGQSMNADQLNKLLLLARCLSLSEGNTTLDWDTWEKAVKMEALYSTTVKQIIYIYASRVSIYWQV